MEDRGRNALNQRLSRNGGSFSARGFDLRIRAGQGSLLQDVAFDGGLELLTSRARAKIELDVQGIDPRSVAMGSRGWARTRVAKLSAVVPALYAEVVMRSWTGYAFIDLTRRGMDAVQQPMREAAGARRVGIVQHKGQRPRARRNVGPHEIGGKILTVTRVAGWYRATWPVCCAPEFHSHAIAYSLPLL